MCSYVYECCGVVYTNMKRSENVITEAVYSSVFFCFLSSDPKLLNIVEENTNIFGVITVPLKISDLLTTPLTYLYFLQRIHCILIKRVGFILVKVTLLFYIALQLNRNIT